MVYLLLALLSGYAVGMLITGKWRPYVLCLPASALAYFISIAVLTGLTSEGLRLPHPVMFVAASLIQAPVLMLGTYLAKRKKKRNHYEA